MDGWDLPPKPKGMRWATYEKCVDRFDAAEEMLDAQPIIAAARLMRRLQLGNRRRAIWYRKDCWLF